MFHHHHQRQKNKRLFTASSVPPFVSLQTQTNQNTIGFIIKTMNDISTISSIHQKPSSKSKTVNNNKTRTTATSSTVATKASSQQHQKNSILPRQLVPLETASNNNNTTPFQFYNSSHHYNQNNNTSSCSSIALNNNSIDYTNTSSSAFHQSKIQELIHEQSLRRKLRRLMTVKDLKLKYKNAFQELLLATQKQSNNRRNTNSNNSSNNLFFNPLTKRNHWNVYSFTNFEALFSDENMNEVALNRQRLVGVEAPTNKWDEFGEYLNVMKKEQLEQEHQMSPDSNTNVDHHQSPHSDDSYYGDESPDNNHRQQPPSLLNSPLLPSSASVNQQQQQQPHQQGFNSASSSNFRQDPLSLVTENLVDQTEVDFEKLTWVKRLTSNMLLLSPVSNNGSFHQNNVHSASFNNNNNNNSSSGNFQQQQQGTRTSSSGNYYAYSAASAGDFLLPTASRPSSHQNHQHHPQQEVIMTRPRNLSQMSGVSSVLSDSYNEQNPPSNNNNTNANSHQNHTGGAFQTPPRQRTLSPTPNEYENNANNTNHINNNAASSLNLPLLRKMSSSSRFSARSQNSLKDQQHQSRTNQSSSPPSRSLLAHQHRRLSGSTPTKQFQQAQVLSRSSSTHRQLLDSGADESPTKRNNNAASNSNNQNDLTQQRRRSSLSIPRLQQIPGTGRSVSSLASFGFASARSPQLFLNEARIFALNFDFYPGTRVIAPSSSSSLSSLSTMTMVMNNSNNNNNHHNNNEITATLLMDTILSATVPQSEIGNELCERCYGGPWYDLFSRWIPTIFFQLQCLERDGEKEFSEQRNDQEEDIFDTDSISFNTIGILLTRLWCRYIGESSLALHPILIAQCIRHAMSSAVAARVDMSTTGQLLMDFAVDCFLENVSTRELSALLGAVTSIANEALTKEEVEFWRLSSEFIVDGTTSEGKKEEQGEETRSQLVAKSTTEEDEEKHEEARDCHEDGKLNQHHHQNVFCIDNHHHTNFQTTQKPALPPPKMIYAWTIDLTNNAAIHSVLQIPCSQKLNQFLEQEFSSSSSSSNSTTLIKALFEPQDAGMNCFSVAASLPDDDHHNNNNNMNHNNNNRSLDPDDFTTPHQKSRAHHQFVIDKIIVADQEPTTRNEEHQTENTDHDDAVVASTLSSPSHSRSSHYHHGTHVEPGIIGIINSHDSHHEGQEDPDVDNNNNNNNHYQNISVISAILSRNDAENEANDITTTSSVLLNSNKNNDNKKFSLRQKEQEQRMKIESLLHEVESDVVSPFRRQEQLHALSLIEGHQSTNVTADHGDDDNNFLHPQNEATAKMNMMKNAPSAVEVSKNWAKVFDIVKNAECQSKRLKKPSQISELKEELTIALSDAIKESTASSSSLASGFTNNNQNQSLYPSEGLLQCAANWPECLMNNNNNHEVNNQQKPPPISTSAISTSVLDISEIPKEGHDIDNDEDAKKDNKNGKQTNLHYPSVGSHVISGYIFGLRDAWANLVQEAAKLQQKEDNANAQQSETNNNHSSKTKGKEGDTIFDRLYKGGKSGQQQQPNHHQEGTATNDEEDVVFVVDPLDDDKEDCSPKKIDASSIIMTKSTKKENVNVNASTDHHQTSTNNSNEEEEQQEFPTWLVAAVDGHSEIVTSVGWETLRRRILHQQSYNKKNTKNQHHRRHQTGEKDGNLSETITVDESTKEDEEPGLGHLLTQVSLIAGDDEPDSGNIFLDPCQEGPRQLADRIVRDQYRMENVADGWEDQVEFQQSATSQFFCFHFDIFSGAEGDADRRLRKDLVKHGALGLFTSIAAAASNEYGFEWERSLFGINNNNSNSSHGTPPITTKIPKLQMLIRVPDAVEEQLTIQKEMKDPFFFRDATTDNNNTSTDVTNVDSSSISFSGGGARSPSPEQQQRLIQQRQNHDFQRRSTSPFSRLHDDTRRRQQQQEVSSKTTRVSTQNQTALDRLLKRRASLSDPVATKSSEDLTLSAVAPPTFANKRAEVMRAATSMSMTRRNCDDVQHDVSSSSGNNNTFNQFTFTKTGGLPNRQPPKHTADVGIMMRKQRAAAQTPTPKI